MFVKPSQGLLVLDPDSKLPIPVEGKEVPESTYWFRRIRCGDVVLVVADVVTKDQISDSSAKGEE